MKYPISATLSLPPIEAGESAASVGALRFLKEQGFDGADLSTYFLDLSDWRRTYEAVAAASPHGGGEAHILHRQKKPTPLGIVPIGRKVGIRLLAFPLDVKAAGGLGETGGMDHRHGDLQRRAKIDGGV